MRLCCRPLLQLAPGRSASSSSGLRSARDALRKRLGQHLLINGGVLRAIVAAAGLEVDAAGQPCETVLEIGPGTGNLTALLLPAAAAVFAVELDPRLAARAVARAAAAGHGGKFFCTVGDVLRLPLPRFDRLVANIPYQISSPVLARLWAAAPPPRSATLLLQREFAERLAATPGSAAYSRLSVNAALLSASVRIVMTVGREQFVPPPRVDSAVVHIVPRGPPAGLDWPRWETFLRVAFGGKNKRLRSVIANKHVLAGLLSGRGGGGGGGGGGAVGGSADDAEDGSEDGAVDDVVATQAGPVSRAHLVAARARLDAVLGAIGALDWRANGMTVEQFRAVFDALGAAGWRFAPAHQRYYPVLAAPVPAHGCGDDARTGRERSSLI